MKEFGVLFNDLMSHAIREDRKRTTRRMVEPQPIDNTEIDGNFFEGNHKGYVKVDGHPNWREQFALEFAPYKTGDILYVREKYYQRGWWKLELNPKRKGGMGWVFQPVDDVVLFDAPEKFLRSHAGLKDKSEIHWYKRNSLFMPKSVARIWLQVTGVKCERLQDISEEDAVREGIESAVCGDGYPLHLKGKTLYRHYPHLTTSCGFMDAKDSFQSLWEVINGQESWDANPWVFAYDFKVLSTTGRPELLTQSK